MLQGGILHSSMVAFVSFSFMVEGNFTGLLAPACTTEHLKAAASAGTIVASRVSPAESATGSMGAVEHLHSSH